MKDIVLQEQYLIDIWRNHRYWNNEIEDPNLVPEYLEIEEVAKYVIWRQEYLDTIEKLSKLTRMNSTLFYACRPWAAALDKKEVIIKNLN